MREGSLEASVVLETSEQVGIDLELAGLGSRFMAAILDGLCMLILLLAAAIAPFFLLNNVSGAAEQALENAGAGRSLLKGVDPVAAMVLFLGQFAVLWGYYIVAELVTDGRSPGKRAMGLRVVCHDGTPVGFAQIAVRNLVRIVDFLPAFYGLGLLVAMLSSRTQRLGDLAAGTLVIKDRAGQVLASMPKMAETVPGPVAGPLLSTAERAVVSRYFARAAELDPAARARICSGVAGPIRARLGDVGPRAEEEFLRWALEQSGGPL